MSSPRGPSSALLTHPRRCGARGIKESKEPLNREQIPKIAADGTKSYVDVGPGKHGFPQLVPYVEKFERDVKRLLYGPLAEQVPPPNYCHI